MVTEKIIQVKFLQDMNEEHSMANEDQISVSTHFNVSDDPRLWAACKKHFCVLQRTVHRKRS